MQRTFKFRLYPTRDQERTLRQWLFMTRQVYNAALEERTAAWKRAALFAPKSPERKACTVTFYRQTKELTELRSEMQEVADVPYTIMRDTALLRVERAMQSFLKHFKEGWGHPKFKSAKFWNSVRTEQPTDIRVTDDGVRLPKIGVLKARFHRPCLGRPRTCTVALEPDGWYIAVGCDNVPERAFRPTDRKVGIHTGLRKLIWMDTGRQIENPKHIKASEDKLAKLQRWASRRKKGSNRWKKMQKLVAKLHQKVRRQRHHYLAKWAYRIVSRFGVIGIEKWQIRKMVEHEVEFAELRKLVHDGAWATLWGMIRNLCEEAKRTLVEIPFEPSTKRCSKCGAENAVLPRQIEYKCGSCGHIQDRDENSAANVRQALDRELSKLGGARPSSSPPQ